jgi:FtsH-binding integral membrane protein
MAATKPAIATPKPAPILRPTRIDAALGILVGIAGGALQSHILHSSTLGGIVLGAGFGLVFSLVFSRRTSSAGAGLIWGLSGALLLWVATPAVGMLVHSIHDSSRLLAQVRDRFSQLAAYLICLGAPTGLALGIRGSLSTHSNPPFRWSRAILAGGFAGVASGLFLSYWSSQGGFFPLIAGLGEIHSRSVEAIFQFAIAFIIGGSFGLLFQRDVRGYGSCMGWGLCYAVLWWFLGPLSLFPLLRGMPLNWSTDLAGDLFGALVGYTLYGLILGVIYATLDKVWVRLFIQSDPLNRESEGPGFRLFRSLQWGAIAGLTGGIVSSPFLFASHVLSNIVGVDTHLSAFHGLLVHLLVSTIIGMSYGVLFRDEASNLGMASAWGGMFGLIWWYIGPLTLLPLILTGEVDWRITAVSTLLPSLLGHLIYGACTASVFYIFEYKDANKRVLDSRMAARELRRLRPVGTPAPAVWFLVMALGIIIPLLLS